MNQQKDKLSIVLLSYQSENNIIAMTGLVQKEMVEATIPFELIIIDDCSSDQSFEIAQKMESQFEFVSAYQLSKNYGSPNAQFAGLRLCTGNCVVFIPDDLQRPISVVIEMYRAWQQGYKLVIANRSERNDGVPSDLFSKSFYFLMNKFSQVKFPPGGADGFLADREIIDVLNHKISQINTSPIVEVLKLGYPTKLIPFVRPQSKSKSRWTWSKKWRLALNSFFSSSAAPLKFISWLGLSLFVFSILLFLIFIISKLFFNSTFLGFHIPGWTSLVLVSLFFNGLTLLSLGIIAEYIWRIFDEVKGKPNYIIKDKTSSRND